MPSTHTEKFNSGPTNNTARPLCPCASLLIEMLRNEGSTKKSEAFVVDDFDPGDTVRKRLAVNDPLIGI